MSATTWLLLALIFGLLAILAVLWGRASMSRLWDAPLFRTADQAVIERQTKALQSPHLPRRSPWFDEMAELDEIDKAHKRAHQRAAGRVLSFRRPTARTPR